MATFFILLLPEEVNRINKINKYLLLIFDLILRYNLQITDDREIYERKIGSEFLQIKDCPTETKFYIKKEIRQ